MNSSICKLILTLGLSGLICLFLSLAQADILNLSLGGKSTSASCYPCTLTIAESVNHNSFHSGMRITIRSKRDSASIIRDVMSGKFNFGVARMEDIYQAYYGLAEWQGNPQTDLRSLFNVYGEHIALFSSLKSEIKTVQNLKGRRVFIGAPRSDLLHTVKNILTAAEIDPERDLTITGHSINEAVDMLSEDDIDAFFMTMGFINRNLIDSLSENKKVCLVPITGKGISQMIARNPFYEKATIGNQEYPYLVNHPTVMGLNIKAGLITTKRTKDKTAYKVIREVFDNRKSFRIWYPNAKIMTYEEMTKSLAAPLHPGAVKYYQEFGIPYDFYKP